ncbi:TPA: CCA tRNA nucleotidyltransferase [Candidatus Micrarchaeota archaeon]|nr:CCA tRNA nucleotidyltransferase [Candidatus Micrarchaeota archaeon]
MSFAPLKRKILAKVSPTGQEAQEEKRFALGLAATLQKIGGVKVSFVGSAARDTGLRGDNDIDIFVQYPASLEKEFIVKKTFEFTRKNIKANWIIRYAEHPYLQARIGNFKVEIIPCFVAEPHGGIKSAVDRSPLHMDYLQRRLTPQQREDVRVLKQLLKNNGIYGAELSVRGFSGLVCEYLMLNYRSFENLVKEAAKWKPPVRIDIEGDSEKPFSEPFVLVDAIDRNRNAGAVVSETNLNRFIALCTALAAKPSEKFFFFKPKAISKSEILKRWEKRATSIALVEMKAPDLVEDISLPQLKRTEESIFRNLTLSGFPPMGSTSFEANGKSFLLFEFHHEKRPTLRKIIGPPAWNGKAVAEFLKGKKPLRGPYVEGERVVVEETEENASIFQALEKIKKTPVDAGVASNYLKPIRQALVRRNQQVFEAPCLGELQRYFFKREPWW